jgi:hypothetical protein
MDNPKGNLSFISWTQYAHCESRYLVAADPAAA